MSREAFNQFNSADAMPLIAGVRIVRRADLDADDLAAWARLSQRSGADSVYACDWFARAVLSHFDREDQYRLFIATDALGEWDGVAVLAAHQWLGRMPLGHWCGLTNANQFLGVPLVRCGREAAFWAALIHALDRLGGGQAALHLTDCPGDHRVVAALVDHCAREGRAVEQLARHERAALLSSHTLTQRPELGMTAKRQARLRSLERKLERDHGPARCSAVADDAGVARWTADFLRLEAAGWKGRAGSALASSPDSAALFTDVVRSAHAHGGITCLSLEVGGRVIAMSSFFLKDGHGFGFKCCFDEDFASYAPGILLLRQIMTRVGDGPGIRFDSCSAPTEATINALWSERRVMMDLCIELRGQGAETRYAAAMTARRAWHWWKRFSAEPRVNSA